MGRKAGHLALGIGKAAGTTLTLIPEEFNQPLRLKTIVDTLVGAIIKRLSYGRRDGVAMIAEGVVLDVSRSMAYRGGAPMSKLEFGSVLAASLAFLMNRQRDATGLIAFDDRIAFRMPASARSSATAAPADSTSRVKRRTASEASARSCMGSGCTSGCSGSTA